MAEKKKKKGGKKRAAAAARKAGGAAEHVRRRAPARGTPLVHVAGGRAVARCVYGGPGDWRFRGRRFASPSAAANAAWVATGRRPRKLNGWAFWSAAKKDPPRA